MWWTSVNALGDSAIGECVKVGIRPDRGQHHPDPGRQREDEDQSDRQLGAEQTSRERAVMPLTARTLRTSVGDDDRQQQQGQHHAPARSPSRNSPPDQAVRNA